MKSLRFFSEFFSKISSLDLWLLLSSCTGKTMLSKAVFLTNFSFYLTLSSNTSPYSSYSFLVMKVCKSLSFVWVMLILDPNVGLNAAS